jgi:predicted alpha/beta-fold hydrolase
MHIRNLEFKPALRISSKHFQMIAAALLPPGKAPHERELLVDVGFGDRLSCLVSTPPDWRPQGRTIVLIHGLGGSHLSPYMIRMARKLYARNDQVIRINLRNCGTGKGLSKRFYSAGTSADVRMVLDQIKKLYPDTSVQLIGFSLGGNIALKLAAELSTDGADLLKTCIAVCPPVDLERAVEAIQSKENSLYHARYLNSLLKQVPDAPRSIKSLFQFDDLITGPMWGYSGAREYYQKCSSGPLLKSIQCQTHLLFAADDPFIPMDSFLQLHTSEHVHCWMSRRGSHMGFLGSVFNEFHWLDHLLLEWTKGNFSVYETI